MRRARILDSLRVVTPCPVAWASMKGDDAVRFCDRCQKNVYNVAALGPAEALELVQRAEGRVCMILTRRPDGTVVTGDCWAQLRRARKRGLLALATAAPVIIATYIWSQAFGLRALARFFQDSPSLVRGGVKMVDVPPAPGGIGFAPPDAFPTTPLGEAVITEPPDSDLARLVPPRRKKRHARRVRVVTVTAGGIAPRNDNAE